MFIKVDNSDDFKSFISDLAEAGETNIKIINSSTKIQTGISKQNKKVKFIFVLFSSVYEIIYSGIVKNNQYEKLLASLIEFREKNSYSFQIQKFNSVRLGDDESHITVNNKLETI